MRFLVFFLLCSAFSCPPQRSNIGAYPRDTAFIELQGHRGCRGLRPENSWPAFQHAIDLGVSTLEMDVVLSKDSMLIVSHEPWISMDICQQPPAWTMDGEGFNIYRMPAKAMQEIYCGTIPQKRFPEQLEIPVHKPILTDLVHTIKHYCDSTGKHLPSLNIEIKSQEEWEWQFQPSPVVYVRRFLERFDGLDYPAEITVQSFDPRILIELNTLRPDIPLVYLTDKIGSNPEKAVEELGFKPAVYSPYFKLVGKKDVKSCRALGMRMVVWTVNERKDFERMIELGVDGIITDYPDRAIVVFEREKIRH